MANYEVMHCTGFGLPRPLGLIFEETFNLVEAWQRSFAVVNRDD